MAHSRHATAQGTLQFKRILVPVDGSELTERAIEASIALAVQLGASIVGFVAVVTRSLLLRPRQDSGEAGDLDGDENVGPTGPVLARFAAAARAAKEQDLARLARERAEAEKRSADLEQVPSIDKAIIAAAESHRCDMIVMVTRGRGAFGEYLFASQTKAVLAGSKLPLLVLH